MLLIRQPILLSGYFTETHHRRLQHLMSIKGGATLNYIIILGLQTKQKNYPQKIGKNKQ